MKASGETTSLMVLENILQLTDLSTKAVGKMIYNTVMELKQEKMELNTKENTKMERKTAMGNSAGLMDHLMKETLKTTILRDMEPTFGQIKECIKVIGETIK